MVSIDRVPRPALLDLRVGRDITELQRTRRRLPSASPAIVQVLQGLARYYRGRSIGRGEHPPELMGQIDAALASVAAHDGQPQARTRAAVALVGIRRDIYPDTFQPPAGIGLQESAA